MIFVSLAAAQVLHPLPTHSQKLVLKYIPDFFIFVEEYIILRMTNRYVPKKHHKKLFETIQNY